MKYCKKGRRKKVAGKTVTFLEKTMYNSGKYPLSQSMLILSKEISL